MTVKKTHGFQVILFLLKSCSVISHHVDTNNIIQSQSTIILYIWHQSSSSQGEY